MTQKVKWQRYTCDLQFEYYVDKTLCIRLFDPEVGPIATATYTFPGLDLDKDCVLIKSFAHQAGLLEAMEAAKIVERTGRSYQGFMEARLLIPVPSLDEVVQARS